jgi:hypothetical protein
LRIRGRQHRRSGRIHQQSVNEIGHETAVAGGESIDGLIEHRPGALWRSLPQPINMIGDAWAATRPQQFDGFHIQYVRETQQNFDAQAGRAFA